MQIKFLIINFLIMNKLKSLLLVCLLIGATVFLGCDNKEDEEYIEVDELLALEPNMYLVGSLSGKNNIAKLWKSGESINLTNGTYDACANSIYVSGNDVYIAGIENTNKETAVNGYSTNYFAKQWKNGTAQNLTDGTLDARANSVFVSGNDVYVAGQIDTDYSRFAVLWINGEEQYHGEGVANSVYVSGNEVYVAGSRWLPNKQTRAVLWKDGEAQYFTDGSEATSVFVSGGNVYVAGYEKVEGVNNTYVPKLWINGETQNISTGIESSQISAAWSVFVSGSDVYVCGNIADAQRNRYARLWKNGVEQTLADDKSEESVALSVIVKGSDVYVLGFGMKNNGAIRGKVWKNGEVKTFPGNVQVLGMFIVD